MASKKAGFAAAASQLFNENKNTLATNRFSINLDLTSNPLQNTNTSLSTAGKTSTAFVFGAGLTSRVVHAEKTNHDMNEDDTPKDAAKLLSDVAAHSGDKKVFLGASGASTSDWEKEDSLTPAPSTPLDQAEKPVTGEEDEKNLFTTGCKIYQYDVDSKTWKERGPSTLRVNETDDSKCRIVARSAGSQKVLLNSILFADMVFESVSDKRIKISAQAPGTDLPQLFLLHGTPAQVAQLSALLETKIAECKATTTATNSDTNNSRKRRNDGDGDCEKKAPRVEENGAVS